MALNYSKVGWDTTKYLNPTNMNQMDNGIKAVSDAVDGFPKVYNCFGHIANGGDGIELLGYGSAMVTVHANGICIVDFEYVVTTADSSNKFFYGLNSYLLSSLNPSLPTIVPKLGGVIHYFDSNGNINNTLEGHGGTVEIDQSIWKPARVYSTNGDIGAWPCSAIPQYTRITGTVFGEVAN